NLGMVEVPLPVDHGRKETPIASLADPAAGLELRYFYWRMHLIKFKAFNLTKNQLTKKIKSLFN
ncbi:MAG: hypothetical protein KDA57_22305, partial [Planctomycetales bacterium]|nr:hypothetical protein [Planctomycetales bacterium]